MLSKWQRSLRHELRSRSTTSMRLLHVLAVFFGLVTVITADRSGPLTAWRLADLLTTGPVTTGAILVCVLCTVSVASEFRFETIRQSVSWIGSRHYFVMTKIVANGISAVLICLVTLALGWILLISVFRFRNSHLPIFGIDLIRLGLTSLLFVFLWSLVGAGIALLARSQVVGVGIVLGLFGMGEPLLTGWLGPNRSEWFPFESSRSGLTWIHPEDPFQEHDLAPAATNILYAVAPLATIACCVLLVGWISFVRRDL